MYRVKIGGQNNNAAGIDPQDWDRLTGGKKLLEGRMFDPDHKCTDWLYATLVTGGGDKEAAPIVLTDKDLEVRGGMELVVDERLAKSKHFHVGDRVEMENHSWTIVGIAPEGVMSRVFLPRRTAQRFFGGMSLTRSTMQFVKLKPGVDKNAAVAALRNDYADLMPKSQFRAALDETWSVMTTYISIVNAIALVIAFLFIMITLYMMVLQRTRDIAILKSCGASSRFILRQMLVESMLLTLAGTVCGVAMSFPAAWLIAALTLYTVQLSWHWILIALVAAGAGAFLSSLYPAWRATRVDMVEALTFE